MSLPNPVSNNWNDLHIGGSSNDPYVLHLIEENLMTNGDFEETLSGWDNELGAAPTRVDAGVDAPKGNYVMRLQAGAITHRAIAFDGTKILLSGFLRFNTTCAAARCRITLYITADANYVAAPAASYVRVDLQSVDAYVAATDYFMPFYLMLECAASSYVHINIECEAGVDVYIDDLQMYEVENAVDLYEPNKMSLKYQYVKDADYELFDGTKKLYAKGWRPLYNIGYDFVDPEGLQKVIKMTEKTFNFFIPHSNNLNGSYVRFCQDFNVSPFQDKFLGHSISVDMEGIFLQKYKNREYGESYFDVASA